jgi:iron complex outermembrane recepter protein
LLRLPRAPRTRHTQFLRKGEVMTVTKQGLLLAGLVTLVASPPLLAQDTPEESGGLQEVVITAEKREGTVQDTPISIAAFSGDDLASGGVVSTEQLTAVTPGLVVQREVIGKVVIRGIGTENFTVGSDPGVAIHQDGVYLARSSTSVFEFFDTQRIEVLRGPQGTLYGRNATGGVLNIISNKPDDEFGGYAKLDIGNYSKRRLEGALNVPFSDSAAGRLSVLYAERDGFTKNLFPGAAARGIDELDNQDMWAARGQLRFDLGESVELLVQADISRDDANPSAFKYFDTSNAFWFNPMSDRTLPNLREVSQGYEQNISGTTRTAPELWKADTSGGNIKLTWDLGFGEFVSQTAYRKTEFAWLNDGDGFDQFFVTYFQDDDSEQISQEFQLSSTGDGRLDWIIGAFYLDEQSTTFSGLAFELGVPPPAINGILIDGESNTQSYSIFAQGTYDFTDRLRGTIGLRYTNDKKDGDLVYYSLFNLFATNFQNPFSPPPAGFATWRDALDESWSALTPKVGLDFDFTDNVMGYVSATRGFKSGGFNLLAAQPPYDPEFLWSYEVGLKTKSADGKLIANFGAFFYDYTDLQVGKIVRLQDVVTNAAKATVKGLEAEIRYAATDVLEFNLGLAWLDSEYDEFCATDPVLLLPTNQAARQAIQGRCFGDLDEPNAITLDGNELRRAPNFTGNVGIALNQPVENGRILARVDYAYKSSQFFTQFNRPIVGQEGYGLLNLRFGYAGANDKWSVTAYADNLLDETYFSTVLESGVAAAQPDPNDGVVPQAVLGAPRTYGVSIKYEF